VLVAIRDLERTLTAAEANSLRDEIWRCARVSVGAERVECWLRRLLPTNHKGVLCCTTFPSAPTSRAPPTSIASAKLGFKRASILPYGIGYGDKQPAFWVQLPHDQQAASTGNGVRRIQCDERTMIAFHSAALRRAAPTTAPGGPTMARTISARSCATLR
jgi:hypothetical protein